MTRYATIGTSSIVDVFLQAGAQLPGFNHTVAYSRDAGRGEAFAIRHGTARVETSLDALAAAGDVDVVYIASPNTFHHSQAALMLEGGKHVVVEKAAAANAREFADLLDKAANNEHIIVESIRGLFDPSRAVIESLLTQLGPIRRANLTMCQRSRRYDRFLGGETVNIFDLWMAAGALMDIGTYCVNPLIEWFGLPQSIQVVSLLLENGIDGAGTILATYPGMLADVTYSKVTNSEAPSEIQGEDATLVIDAIHDPRHLRLLYTNGQVEDITVEKPLLQQTYVLNAMNELIAHQPHARTFNKTSLTALQLMDDARSKSGIHFPSNPN